MHQEPIKLSVDTFGRQWWRVNCSVCDGQYGCRETAWEPSAPFVCTYCTGVQLRERDELGRIAESDASNPSI